MALQIPPPPNLNVQVPDLTQKALEGAQLRNFLSETALRQSLAPLQVQEEQQKVQASTQENMLRQMSIDSNKKMMEFIASGGLSNFVGKNSNAPEGSGFDAMGASQELFKQGIIPEVANPIITHFQNIDKATSEIAKNYGAAAADYLKNRATAHAQLADSLDEALHSKDPAGGIPLVLAKFLKNPEGLSQEEIGGLKQLQGLRGDPLVKATQLASATLNLGAEMDKHHAELAETQAKAVTATTEATEAQAEAAGQVTPKMATKQKLELEKTKVEAQIHGQIQASILPLTEEIRQTFANQKDARDKIETGILKPYQDKLTDIQMARTAIAQAADNPVAARAAVFKMVGVAQPTGSHRVLPMEFSAFKYPGGLSTQAVEHFNDWVKGSPWTPDVAQAANAFIDGQAQAAQQNLNSGVDNVNKLYGTNVGKGLQASVQGGGPQIGAIEDGYRFKGGDPSKATSWEKVKK